MTHEIWVGTVDGIRRPGGDGGRVELAGSDVSVLAKDGSRWWAIVDRHELWSDDGAGWARVAALEGLIANCLLPTDERLYVGTAESHVYMPHGDRLEPVGSFDETPGRGEWFTPWGGPPDVRSMSADATGAIYVNVHVGGVVRSADRGGSWQPTLDIRSDVHEVIADERSGLVLAASARGLGVSADRGDTWSFHTDGLHGNYMWAVAVAGSTMLATASTGPYTDRAAVYRRPVGSDVAFEKCKVGLPEWFPSNVDSMCLAGSGSTAAFGTSEGGVYISTDEGATWDTVAEGLPLVRCVLLA